MPSKIIETTEINEGNVNYERIKVKHNNEERK